MGEIDVAEGAAFVDPSFQAPGWIQPNLNEAVAIPLWDRGSADHDGSSLAWVEGLQLQIVAALPQAQPKAAAKVLTTAAKGIAIAVEVTAADPGEVEGVEGRIHQTVRSQCPAAGSLLDLLQHQQLPVALSHRLSQHRKAVLLQRLAVEQAAGGLSRWQPPRGAAKDCGQDQAAEVSSPHQWPARNHVVSKPAQGEQWLKDGAGWWLLPPMEPAVVIRAQGAGEACCALKTAVSRNSAVMTRRRPTTAWNCRRRWSCCSG